MAETPEYTFQASFSVPQCGDQFVTIDIPRQAFVSVKRASVTYDQSSALLQTDSVAQIGFVYSRFEFNGGANPQYVEGDFALDVQSVEFVRYGATWCVFPFLLKIIATSTSTTTTPERRGPILL